jgi:hypothetical protein
MHNTRHARTYIRLSWPLVSANRACSVRFFLCAGHTFVRVRANRAVGREPGRTGRGTQYGSWRAGSPGNAEPPGTADQLPMTTGVPSRNSTWTPSAPSKTQCWPFLPSSPNGSASGYRGVFIVPVDQRILRNRPIRRAQELTDQILICIREFRKKDP